MLANTTTATSTTSVASAESTDPATRARIAAMCLVLGGTAIAAVPLGLLWRGGTNSGAVLTVADVETHRQNWWILIMSGAILTALNAPAQAIAVLTLIRDRGAKTATWGAGLMWIGAVLEAVGLAGFGAAYYYASDPSASLGGRTEVFNSIAA